MCVDTTFLAVCLVFAVYLIAVGRTFACMLLWDYLPIVLLVATFSTAASGRFAQRTGAFVHLDPSLHMYEGLQAPTSLNDSAHGAAAGADTGGSTSGSSDVETSTASSSSKRGRGNLLFSNFGAGGTGEAKRGSNGYGSFDASRKPGGGRFGNHGGADSRGNPNGYYAESNSRGAASFPRWTQSLGLPWGAGSSLPTGPNEATARNLRPTTASRLPHSAGAMAGGKGGYPSAQFRRNPSLGGGESKSNSGGGAGAGWGGVPSSLERVPVRGPSRETYHMALVDRERLGGTGLTPLPPSFLSSAEEVPQAHIHRGGGRGAKATDSRRGADEGSGASTPPPLQMHPVDHGANEAPTHRRHPQRPSADLSGIDARRAGALGNLVAARAVGRSPAHPPPVPATTVGHFPPPVQQQQMQQQQQQRVQQPLQPMGRRPGVAVNSGSSSGVEGGDEMYGALGFSNSNAYDNLPQGELKGAMELEASLGERYPHQNQPHYAPVTSAVLPPQQQPLQPHQQQQQQQQAPPLPLTPPPPPPPLQPTISPQGGNFPAPPHPALSLTYTLADAPGVHYPAAAAPGSGGALSWSSSNSRNATGSSRSDTKSAENN